MGPVQWFLTVYVLGGVTFIPLVLALLALHAYYILPISTDGQLHPGYDPAQLLHVDDEKAVLKSGTDDLVEKFHRKHESDVAAGYFAVCREYVPGGVNGKPPDKLSPAGEVVATESPSVYQSMYRSLFDRSHKPTIEPSKDGANKSVKNIRNVFYVVLRHGHLMLYDDIQQLEVRYVISLEYHDVDIYGGGEEISEGELWMKRNAIRLTRKGAKLEGKPKSLPFYLFSENLSEKEDFYFALLSNQEKKNEDSPVPQDFDVKHIVMLVQKLHSSEDNLQTRWINAMIGRLFLAMYKTPEFEQFIRQKLTKKISRVKKPTFITKISLQKIDTGIGAPFITNPRLKDLTVNGDCTVEADVAYAGNFRIEIAATARIDLGTRFKAREVDMVLAATCRKLQGHALLRFKPPPSNRLWFTFEKMPQFDLAIEPIVSSRQITYTVILRAIESRIREVIAETVCLPFWDDIPFLDTKMERYRGGIWKREPTTTINTEIVDEDPEDEAEFGSSGTRTPIDLIKKNDTRVMSMPALIDEQSAQTATLDKDSTSSTIELVNDAGEAKSSSQSPKMMSSTSLTSTADPMTNADHADGDGNGNDIESSGKHDSVTSFLRDLNAKSLNASPAGSQADSIASDSVVATAMKDRPSSSNSKDLNTETTNQESQSTFVQPPVSQTPNQSILSTKVTNQNDDGSQPSPLQEESKRGKGFANAAKSLTAPDRKQALASINAATTAAQKWGWGVLAKNRQKEAQVAENGSQKATDSATEVPAAPMGRGRPLPPPGMPLPPPQKTNTRPNLFSIPKRKSVPPPLLPKRPETNETDSPTPTKSSPRPPLPERRRRQTSMTNDDQEENDILVVAAPTESAPTSPVNEHHDEFLGQGEHPEAQSQTPLPEKPPLPLRTNDNENMTSISKPLERLEQHKQVEEDRTSDLDQRI